MLPFVYVGLLFLWSGIHLSPVTLLLRVKLHYWIMSKLLLYIGHNRMGRKKNFKTKLDYYFIDLKNNLYEAIHENYL